MEKETLIENKQKVNKTNKNKVKWYGMRWTVWKSFQETCIKRTPSGNAVVSAKYKVSA